MARDRGDALIVAHQGAITTAATAIDEKCLLTDERRDAVPVPGKTVAINMTTPAQVTGEFASTHDSSGSVRLTLPDTDGARRRAEFGHRPANLIHVA